MECIVNVVGAEAYKAAVLKVKSKIEKEKIDPTQQVRRVIEYVSHALIRMSQALNVDRYEELMKLVII